MSGNPNGMMAAVCRHCGRALTHPRSVRLGYGPECAKKLGVVDTVHRPIRRKKSKTSARQRCFAWYRSE